MVNGDRDIGVVSSRRNNYEVCRSSGKGWSDGFVKLRGSRT